MRPRLRADSIRPLMLSLAMFIKLSLSIAMGSFGSIGGGRRICPVTNVTQGLHQGGETFKADLYLPQNQNIQFFQEVSSFYLDRLDRRKNNTQHVVDGKR